MDAKKQLLAQIATEVTDVDEETFYLFSHDFPQRNLGMVDGKPAMIRIEVAGTEYELRQSPGLLTSSVAGGTTGAALWKISLIVAEWLQDTSNSLWSKGILHENAVVVELGCGITGLVGLVMARRVKKYILTDQHSILKGLQANVDSNTIEAPKARGKRRGPVIKPAMVGLNWEDDSVSVLDEVLDSGAGIDMILVCDCVFNDYLIQPLVTTCKDLCQRNIAQTPVVLIAQQLRSDEIFETFMKALKVHFSVWRMTDSALSPALKSGSGFVLHIAVLKTLAD